ncbi:alkaline phosphatase D family protein [Virgisporangium ochraceum]
MPAVEEPLESDSTVSVRSPLILGPVLRRVEGGRATIWVEPNRPGTVEVRAGSSVNSSRTFSAHGHHYGLVVVEDLPPDSVVPYEVWFEGEKAWPPPDYDYPQPAIRTRPEDGGVRILFGSCRESSPLHTDRFPPDALDAYAVRLSGQVESPEPTEWPDLIMLLGDQVYADETSTTMKRVLEERRAQRRPDAPDEQVVDFHEYTQLYVDSWTDPDIRWLFSTVPSVMIFDDHEIIDDWNISDTWRTDINRESWWATRIKAGLATYWVYQHLGNIPPSELEKDPVYQAVLANADDATAVLDEFGTRADSEPGSYRWSYALDLGRTRVVVLDNRAGRQLEPGRRAMASDADWAWLRDAVDGDHDGVVIASSLPWLMPPAIHHLEAASERLTESRRPWVRRRAEKIRRAVDLEHWAAFGRSFDALAELLTDVADREGGPATVCVLSGDVHHSYVARADLPTRSPIYQLTCSPVHNALPGFMKPAMRFSWSRAAAAIGRGIAKAAGLPPPVVKWHRVAGPVYKNAVSELWHDGRDAVVTIAGTEPDKQLHRVARVSLTR